MLDVIICANSGVEKLRNLENTRGQILEFSIEMTGHPYNRAGATAQAVMSLTTASPNCQCFVKQCRLLIIFVVFKMSVIARRR